MNQGQQFLAHLQKIKDEATAAWSLCVRISTQGELVITERRPWSQSLDRRPEGGFSAREMVPDYEPIKQCEGLYETEDASIF